jgi:protein-tyrosine kinase
VDRIRKALDLARLERAQVSESPHSERGPHSERVPQSERLPQPESTPRAASSAIVYSRTKVFEPDPTEMERNRIMGPGGLGPAAAAFRMLRTQVLQRMDANSWRSLALFSPRANDGKSTTAINLALALASGKMHTVLLVDFDLRHPTLAKRMGLSPEFGVDDALVGKVPVEDCFYHPTGLGRLVLLPARGPLENSSEVLAGPRSRELALELRARYPERIVVFDLPPVLSADDALSFAPLVDCGLVVASEGRTRRTELVRTIELLKNTPLVGTVLNRAADLSSGY